MKELWLWVGGSVGGGEPIYYVWSVVMQCEASHCASLFANRNIRWCQTGISIQDIVIFEKNLFHSYSDWSPQLKDLLRDSAKIIAFQRRAYALYKEKFEPGDWNKSKQETKQTEKTCWPNPKTRDLWHLHLKKSWTLCPWLQFSKLSCCKQLSIAPSHRVQDVFSLTPEFGTRSKDAGFWVANLWWWFCSLGQELVNLVMWSNYHHKDTQRNSWFKLELLFYLFREH